MNKRQLHHIWTRLKKLNYWFFLAAFLITGFISIMALRQNNLTALKLRSEVLKVDKEQGDTEAALKNLRRFVHAHMNTNLAGDTSVYPPIQLKYTFERLAAAEKARAESQNGNTYNDAQNFCEKNFPQSFLGAGRLPCIQNYLDSRPNVQAKPIPDSLYKFDFVSPAWSPDLAGISMIVSIFFFLLFAGLFLLDRWFRHQLKLKN